MEATIYESGRRAIACSRQQRRPLPLAFVRRSHLASQRAAGEQGPGERLGRAVQLCESKRNW